MICLGVQTKNMQDSIFTKIIAGDIPSHVVHEDDRTYVFMDIHPIQPGQVLVVPKVQVATVWELSDLDYAAVMSTAKLVAQRLKQVFADKRMVAMHIEGLEVAHAHIKLFPFDTDAQFRHKPDMAAEPDHKTLAEIAQKLAF